MYLFKLGFHSDFDISLESFDKFSYFGFRIVIEHPEHKAEFEDSEDAYQSVLYMVIPTSIGSTTYNYRFLMTPIQEDILIKQFETTGAVNLDMFSFCSDGDDIVRFLKLITYGLKLLQEYYPLP